MDCRCSVVVFGLFISSPEVATRYASPHLIWVAALGLIYWLSRLWIKTGRGEMHDDPLVYALRDRASRLTVLAMALVTLVAWFFLDQPLDAPAIAGLVLGLIGIAAVFAQGPLRRVIEIPIVGLQLEDPGADLAAFFMSYEGGGC